MKTAYPIKGKAWMKPFVCLLVLVFVLPLFASPMPGDQLKPFMLATKDGAAYQWKPGKVTLLSFCAFWCDTWKEQSRRLNELDKRLKGMPFEFVTISVDGRWTELGDNKIPGTVATDPGGAMIKMLNIDRIPYTIVVDQTGKVTYVSQGIMRSETLQLAIREALSGQAESLEKVVYLTFDDFPSKELDDRLLDVLRSEDAQATFFCIGQRVNSSQTIMKRARDEGHSMQLHSWDHDADKPELEKCIKAFESALNLNPNLYRPPGNSKVIRLDTKEEMKHPTANPYDYTRPGKKELIRRVLFAVKPGSVILLHAGVSETIDALPEIIHSLRQRGYRFDVLE